MVFMVNPMPSDDRYVFPVASSFEDFLRLILTCKTANSLDQIVWMDRRQYENLQLETIRNLPKESYDIPNTLEKEFHLSPISDPFRYIKKLVQKFDDSVLRFSDEYYDTLGLDNPNQ